MLNDDSHNAIENEQRKIGYDLIITVVRRNGYQQRIHMNMGRPTLRGPELNLIKAKCGTCDAAESAGFYCPGKMRHNDLLGPKLMQTINLGMARVKEHKRIK